MPRRSIVPSISLAVVAAVCFVSPALAQPTTQTVEDPVTDSLPTNDGWNIEITYYQSPGGKESPVVLLLHGEGGNRLVWSKFAELLQKDGIAVVTVDLRQHGESKPRAGLPSGGGLRPDDYAKMVLFDMAAVKKFVKDKHQDGELNMRKTGIVAADMSAPIAINFALRDWLAKPYNDAPTPAASTPRGQDVRAIVLISPVDRAGRVLTGRELLQLRSPLFNVAFMLAKASGDNLDRRTTDKMYEKLEKGADEEGDKRMYLQEYNTRYRGTDLLGRGRSVPIEAHMLQFFDRHLKSVSDPWADRKSKLED